MALHLFDAAFGLTENSSGGITKLSIIQTIFVFQPSGVFDCDSIDIIEVRSQILVY
jgi:hypothetical protein